jgi:hypothetical protein
MHPAVSHALTLPPTARHPGTFNALPLYVLLFNTITRRLSIQSRVQAHGPHQYLALSPGRGQLYATSWGLPPKLWSWAIEERGGEIGLREVGSAPISEFGRGCLE